MKTPKEVITLFQEMVSPLSNLVNNLKDVGRENKWIKNIFKKRKKKD